MLDISPRVTIPLSILLAIAIVFVALHFAAKKPRATDRPTMTIMTAIRAFLSKCRHGSFTSTETPSRRVDTCNKCGASRTIELEADLSGFGSPVKAMGDWHGK